MATGYLQVESWWLPRYFWAMLHGLVPAGALLLARGAPRRDWGDSAIAIGATEGITATALAEDHLIWYCLWVNREILPVVHATSLSLTSKQFNWGDSEA